jgi:hypothetical protein
LGSFRHFIFGFGGVRAPKSGAAGATKLDSAMIYSVVKEQPVVRVAIIIHRAYLPIFTIRDQHVGNARSYIFRLVVNEKGLLTFAATKIGEDATSERRGSV